MAREIDELHYFIISVTLVGWITLTVLALYFVFRYRRRSEKQPTPRVTAPLVVEVGLTLMLLAFFLVWWAIGYRQFVRLRMPPPGAMEVYVTAKQWMWKFAHPDGRSAISVLTVPANRPVKLLMTSQDVIHSFSVPSFRIKQDVLPGRYTVAWFEATKPGTY